MQETSYHRALSFLTPKILMAISLAAIALMVGSAAHEMNKSRQETEILFANEAASLMTAVSRSAALILLSLIHI